MALLRHEIIDIVQAGGGVIVGADMLTYELVDIAQAAAVSGNIVIVRGTGNKLCHELVEIARAGKGRVIFDLIS